MMDDCILHCVENDQGKLKSESINENKWKTIVHCAHRWAKINCNEQSVAQNILKVDLDPANIHTLQCHVECYRRFTSNRRIEQGEKRKQKDQSVETDAASRPKRDSTSSSKSTTILPAVCLICRKKKWQRVRHGSWAPEPLIQVLCLFCFPSSFLLGCLCVCARVRSVCASPCVRFCLGIYCACVCYLAVCASVCLSLCLCVRIL